MLRRWKESWAVAAAVALHAGALFLLHATLDGRAPSVSRRAPAHPPAELAFDVDLRDDVATEAETLTGPSAPGRGVGRAFRTTRAGTSDVAVEELGPVTPDSAASTETPPAEPAEGAAPEASIDLGLGPDGWQRWVSAPNASDGARAERPQRRSNRFNVFRAPPVSTTGGLQEGLEASDGELGLGPSGRVLSALHHAAHETVAPELGTARFEVTVHRTGAVEVTLGAASGQVENWRKVAAHVAEDLRKKPPRIAPPRAGMKLTVELAAERTMPNGTRTSSLERPHVDAPPMKLKSTEESKEQLRAENPTVENPSEGTLPATILEQPGVYLAESGKVCSYRAGVSVLPPGAQAYREGIVPLGLGASGSCDPSHVGAKPQRMVVARVVEQSMF
ncbi:MAG TPA: hypothetical protein VFZ53_01000 [Polyangiaceae bacterium]